MKKYFVLILSLMLCFLTGCSGAGIVPIALDYNKPWGISVLAYEKSVYEVAITERVLLDGAMTDGRIFADGVLTYELEIKTEGNANYVVVTSTMQIDYRDEEYVGADRDLSDIITSKIKFNNESLSAVESEKTVELAPRKNSLGVYEDTNSYYSYADYIGMSATSKKGKTVSSEGIPSAEYKEDKTFSLASSREKVFDNEQLFYVVRALTKTAPAVAQNINLSNIYDIASTIEPNGKYSNTPITINTKEELSPVELSSSYAQNFMDADENGKYNVQCMETQVYINHANRGPVTTLLITEPDTKFNHKLISSMTGKVIVKIQNLQYDLVSRSESFITTCTLIDYTTLNI